MRQIKFRAWDNQKKKMILDVGVFDNMAVLEPQYVYDSPERQIVELKGSILMQFTGLLDKNGKEIYEGDIVFDEDGEYSKTCIIDWSDEQAKFFGKSVFDYEVYDMDEIYGEIIGNIWENEELLENK